MKNTLIYCIILLGIITACDNAVVRKAIAEAPAAGSRMTPLDREITALLEKGISIGERTRQVTAIEKAFARRTTPQRARQLAALCYTKSLGTPFMPLDLAEIALTETGGDELSASAVSARGAKGVWQLMPYRAKSHGFSPQDMENDEKCAEAAIRELYHKLELAKGNMERAKKLYCGKGPQADHYVKKLRIVRREILDEIETRNDKLAMNESATILR